VNDRLIRHVEEAMATVETSPSLSIVSGMTPTSSESAFGWIEPGERTCPISRSIFRLRRFWRKPPAELAAKLWLKGWLWNSHIVVARAPRLQEMIAECVPALYVDFNAAFASLNDDGDWMAVDSLYRGMGTYEFSQEILSRCPRDLVVKRIDDVGRHDCIAGANRYGHLTTIRDQPADAT
jgi:mannose-1-phosphate guanylyltransferase